MMIDDGRFAVPASAFCRRAIMCWRWVKLAAASSAESATMTPVSLRELSAEFEANPPAEPAAVARCQSDLKFRLPAEYVKFLEQMNGGEGFIGENYLMAWPVQDLVQSNKDYLVEEAAPELFLFGSNGGGEAFAFDTRSSPRRSSLSRLSPYPWKTRFLGRRGCAGAGFRRILAAPVSFGIVLSFDLLSRVPVPAPDPSRRPPTGTGPRVAWRSAARWCGPPGLRCAGGPRGSACADGSWSGSWHSP